MSAKKSPNGNSRRLFEKLFELFFLFSGNALDAKLRGAFKKFPDNIKLQKTIFILKQIFIPFQSMNLELHSNDASASPMHHKHGEGLQNIGLLDGP